MTMRTVLTDKIPESTTPKITAVIKDEDGNPIPAASLTTLTLNLFNLSDNPTFAVINGRTDQDVLNINDVAVDSSGNLTWSTQTADTAIQNAALNEETHRAMFSWSWNAGAKTGRHIIDMTVVNLKKV